MRGIMRWITPARMRLPALLLGAALVAGSAVADPLSLRQAAEAALARSPALDVSRAQVQQAEVGVAQAEGVRLPRLALSLNLTRSNDALTAFGLKLGQQRIEAADFDPARLNNPVAINNFNSRAEITAPIYTGGQLSSRLDMSRAQVRAAQAGDEGSRQQLLLTTLQAYAGVHLAQAQVQLAEQAQLAAEATAKDSDKLYQQGVIVRSDVLSARVHASDTRARLSAARQQLATAQDRLKLVMMKPLGEVLEVGGLAEPALPEGDAQQWQAQALQQHPRLRALREQRDAAVAGVHAARGARRPQVSVMARQDWNDHVPGFSASSYTLAGVLSWNAFDGGVGSAAVDQAQAQRQEVEARLRQAEAEVAFELAAAQRRVQASEERLAVRQDAVRQAEEAQRLNKVRYANGVTTLVDLLGGQARLDQARADLAQSQYERVTARGDLLLASGALTLDRF